MIKPFRESGPVSQHAYFCSPAFPLTGGRLQDDQRNDLWKPPPVRYDIVAIAAVRHETPHIYDDPIAIRSHQENDENEEEKDSDIVKVIPEIKQYPAFSLTAADWDFRNKSFSWHLPNSRLLRTKSDVRSPNRGSPRKPLRVESPKLPSEESHEERTADEVDVSGVSSPGRRSKAPSNVEFRLILVPETSKMLQVALERDTRLISYLSKDSPSNTLSSQKFPTITEVEDEMKCVSSDECSSPLIDIDESTPMIPAKRSESPVLTSCLNSADVGATRRVTYALKPIREHPDEGLASAFENDDSDSPRRATTPKPHGDLVAARCLQRSPSCPTPSKIIQETHRKRDLRPSQRPLEPGTGRRGGPSLPLVGKLGRRHAFRPMDRPNHAPPAPPDQRRAEDQMASESASPSSSAALRKPKLGVTSLNPPSSPSSSSSSFSSSSFSSSTSSLSTTSSSSSAKSGVRRARETPTSPPAEAVRRSPFRRKFQGQRLRPRSAHAPMTSGAEHVLQCCLEGEEEEVPRRGLSASTPSSPRSSSSSSCFPYSSSSSSPVSSFYSSSTSLSISASLSSQSASASSFQFSSSSSCSTMSSSPVSSFLSPSLSAPSSSSVLSLASCSTSPDSAISGHVTPS
nr:mucin-5AC-like [Penaeus vannamei]